MNQNLTDITFLLDRTGSMEVVRQETIQAVNTFLAEQQKVPGDALFSLIQFDSQAPFEVLQRGVPIQQAQRLTPETYVPRAWTPLLDAIGRTIVDTGDRLSKLPEDDRPGKVVLAIMTDGQENASKEYTADRVKQMLTHQQEVYHWVVSFLGANIDAVQTAKDLGIDPKNALTYDHTDHGVQCAAASFSGHLTAYRMTGNRASMHYTDHDRQQHKAGSR